MSTERLTRVTHKERESAAEKLRAAYTLGCLDEDELGERSGLAYSAKTRGELADLMMDLPAIQPGELAAGPPAQSSAGNWPRLAIHALSWSCWVTVAAIGAWAVSVAVSGVAAVVMIAG